jgi:Coenzyme PQQ synthesis protein D (PqqD)
LSLSEGVGFASTVKASLAGIKLVESGCRTPVAVGMLQLNAMNRELSERSIVVATRDQVSSDLGGEVAILDLAGGMYYGLDTVGARVWELVQKPIEVNQIQETIVEEYDADRAHIERDVLAFLQHLADEGLVEVRDDVSA